MTQNLAENFVHLSRWGFRPNRSPELHLNHAESAFNVRPLMVMFKEGTPIELVEVPHAMPQAVETVLLVSNPVRSVLEGDISDSANSLYCMKILSARVSLICRDLVDVERISGCIDQWSELWRISRLKSCSLYTGNDMGFNSAHQMSLNPLYLAPYLAPLMVKPSVIGIGCETRGINSEVSLYGFQGACTLLNESLEKWCQFGILQRTEATGERRRFRDQSTNLCFSKVSHKASARHSAVDLVNSTENDIRQWESRSTKLVFRLRDSVAEVSEQDNELFLLMSLSFVVSSPFLGVGDSNRLSLCNRTIGLGLSLDNELNCIDVLALFVLRLEVCASAERLSVVKAHDIRSIARLRRHLPTQLVLLHCIAVRYRQPSLLPNPHRSAPFVIHLLCSYYTIQRMPLSSIFRLIFVTFSSQYLLTKAYNVWYDIYMNKIQSRIAELEAKGWSLPRIAERLDVAPVTIEKWKSGKRYPPLDKLVIEAMDKLLLAKRIPKKRRYKGHADDSIK
jgi:hypothetical protein